MRRSSTRALVCLTVAAAYRVLFAAAADPPRRKPLSTPERTAMLGLIKAVDLAQETDVTASADDVRWSHDVLKSASQSAYVPFRVSLGGAAESLKSVLVYVRAVSRRDGVRASEERSIVRDLLLRGGDSPSRMPETVFIGPGEMPVGGPATSSGRRTIAGPAEASAVLALQQRDLERQKAAAEAARKKGEIRERSPFLFPFEDYYVADLKPPKAAEPRTLERALSLPPGEYDVYVGVLDRARLKTSSPVIVRQTVTVPDFWDDRLTLSSLILASDVRTLPSPLTPQQQMEHPYTFGLAEVLPVAAAAFTPHDVLSVVYQICNYGAPDSDLVADYTFYRTDNGQRRVFNRTPPQQFSDGDLPKASPWETQAFATQAISLSTFTPGAYELDVTVRDRLTRATATKTIAFTIIAK